jgi:hypothetical protein
MFRVLFQGHLVCGQLARIGPAVPLPLGMAATTPSAEGLSGVTACA